MKPLKGDTQLVTILCDRFWPDAHGGLERKMWNLSRAMAGCGLSVRVITENRTGALENEKVNPGLVVERVASPAYGPFWRCRSLVRLAWWYRVVRSRVGAGTIWANDPRVALAVMAAGRRGDLVYQPIGCHAAMHQLWRAIPGVYTMRTTAGFRWLDRLAYKLAPRVIFESRNVQDQFERFYGRKGEGGCSVEINGVEPAVKTDTTTREQARAQWGLGEHDWVIGFVGRLDPCKDLEFLFRSVASGPLADPGVKLLLVGEGPDRLRLEQLTSRLGLTSRVVWAGRHDNPARAYAAMDVMVLPSVYEAFGNVLMEAMAAGVPVVGRRRDGDFRHPVLTANEELIVHGQTGLLVDPHDPDDLARQLWVLSQFPGAREAMGRRARAWASSRTWHAVVQRYYQSMGRTIDQPLAQAA